MLKELIGLISNIVVDKAMKLTIGDCSSIKLLGGFNNNVFETRVDGNDYILKILPSTQYKEQYVLGELDWINYLAEKDVKVTKPLKGKNRKNIIKIEGEEQIFYCVLFEKSPGDFPKQLEWNTTLFKNWGNVMGRMHALAKSFKPITKGAAIRTYDETLKTLRLDIIDEEIKVKWNVYMKDLDYLPKETDSFGLIHNDLHQHNFHIWEGDMILFDFGDCEHNWFAYDIAISLYHALQNIPFSERNKRREFAKKFLGAFLDAYSKENQIDPWWIEKIQFFLNYRQIFSYMYFINHLDINLFSDQKRKIIEDMKKRIINDIPVLDN